MTIRHLNLHKTGLVHDVCFLDDAVLIQEKSGQRIYIVWSEIPRHGPYRHGTLDVIEKRRRVGHSAPYGEYRLGGVE